MKVVQFRTSLYGDGALVRKMRERLGAAEASAAVCVERDDGDRVRVLGVTALIDRGAFVIRADSWTRTPVDVRLLGGLARGYEVRGRVAGLTLVGRCAPAAGLASVGARSVSAAFGLQVAIPKDHLLSRLLVFTPDEVEPSIVIDLVGIEDVQADDDWEVSKAPLRAVDEGPHRVRRRDRARALFVSTDYGGGVPGDVALGVADAWLEDLRGRANKLLRAIGPLEVHSAKQGDPPPKLEIPWVDRIDKLKLKDANGDALEFREKLRTLLSFVEAAKDPDLTTLEQRTATALDSVGTLRFDVALFDVTSHTRYVDFRMWDIGLWADLADVTFTSIRTVSNGIEISGTLHEFGGSAYYSTTPPPTGEVVALSLVTLGLYAIIVSNAGPIGITAKNATFRLRLAPDASGGNWRIVVDDLSLNVGMTLSSVNVLNLPLVFGVNIFGAAIEAVRLNFATIVTDALKSVVLPLAWPERINLIGAPSVASSRAGLYEGAGTALQASLSWLAAGGALPIGDAKRLLYTFSDAFLRAWIEELCGALKVKHKFTEGDVKNAGIDVPKPPPAPKSSNLDPDDLLAKILATPGAHHGLPIKPMTAPPPSKTALRASLVIDSFDLELVPKSDTAFRLVAKSRLLIETVELSYSLKVTVIPERCSMKPQGGPLGGTIFGPIDPIDPMGPMTRPGAGRFGHGGLPDLGGLPGGGNPQGGGIAGMPLDVMSIPLCNPPHAVLVWVESAKPIKTHVSASLTHSLDVQLGMQIEILGDSPTAQLPLSDQLWFPRIGLRAPSVMASTIDVKLAEPALDTQATWDGVRKLVDGLFGPYFRPLVDADPIVTGVALPFYNFVELGQLGGGAFAYRRDNVTLVWDVDLVENITPLMP